MRIFARVLLFFTLLSFFSATLWAQTAAPAPNRFGAGGLGYFSQAVPQFQGWAALGLPLTSDGKALSYTDYDVSVVSSGGQLSLAGYQLRFSVKTGVAYRIFQTKDGIWSLYGLAAPGFMATGNDFTSAFEYGGFVSAMTKSGWGAVIGLTNEHYGTVSDLAPRLGVIKKF